jgi:hypothetical protein
LKVRPFLLSDAMRADLSPKGALCKRGWIALYPVLRSGRLGLVVSLAQNDAAQ